MAQHFIPLYLNRRLNTQECTYMYIYSQETIENLFFYKALLMCVVSFASGISAMFSSLICMMLLFVDISYIFGSLIFNKNSNACTLYVRNYCRVSMQSPSEVECCLSGNFYRSRSSR